MEDIQVGEYVRTKKQGIKRIDTIFKNKTVNKYGYEIGSEWDGKLYSTIKTTDIAKHSFNIIDLIEVGDYVNGIKVLGKTDEKLGMNYYCYSEQLGENNMLIIRAENIETILTKEQYNSNCYRMEE